MEIRAQTRRAVDDRTYGTETVGSLQPAALTGAGIDLKFVHEIIHRHGARPALHYKVAQMAQAKLERVAQLEQLAEPLKHSGYGQCRLQLRRVREPTA